MRGAGWGQEASVQMQKRLARVWRGGGSERSLKKADTALGNWR